jgi:hypothetical protein
MREIFISYFTTEDLLKINLALLGEFLKNFGLREVEDVFLPLFLINGVANAI